jgi:hypothetical protein
MPSRIWSRFPERKITHPAPAAKPKPGAPGTVKIVPIAIYPKSEGLR